ncbi:hypothetical protein [uncultured Rikenella sp.]|uniref:hypothetical protein n=1 Tax=uncultured Rikenella sp. TaxID=368003 RepID=UPI00262A4DA4|nr:hypothetical protein [uncultured Rikenella sp.]
MYKVSTSGTGTPLAWYPASGYRHSNSGAPVSVGCSGYHWATSVQAVSSNHLAFEPAMLNPSYVNYRGHGLQLRCLAEETEETNIPPRAIATHPRAPRAESDTVDSAGLLRSTIPMGCT